MTTNKTPAAETRRADVPKAPARAPERKCIRCQRGEDAVFGELVRDRYGWLMDRVHRIWTMAEADQWR
jgi:hypothetical protein